MTEISITDYVKEKGTGTKKVLFPFYKDGKALDSGAKWGMSLRAALSMRFRWKETNPNRISFLEGLCSEGGKKLRPVSLELIHSKIVYDLTDGSETAEKTGDGMISVNRSLVPVVTVADCMPLFLYDPVTGVFGAFHSGWKGTGIIADGIALAMEKYGAQAEDACVAIGPHIHSCCYTVDEERADYFASHFTADAVKRTGEYDEKGKNLYELSLLEANLAALKKAGVREGNIVVATDCTCCARCAVREGTDYYPFGSFRRQAAFQAVELSSERKSRLMTVQAAFCGWFA